MANHVDTSTTQPLLLRRAIAFIHDNAHRDITLSDIARSVNVTPRSVQYTFRRHLGTTPLEYLRRVDSTALTVSYRPPTRRSTR